MRIDVGFHRHNRVLTIFAVRVFFSSQANVSQNKGQHRNPMETGPLTSSQFCTCMASIGGDPALQKGKLTYLYKVPSLKNRVLKGGGGLEDCESTGRYQPFRNRILLRLSMISFFFFLSL